MVAGLTTGEKGFAEVDAGLLLEATNDPSRFVTLKGPVGIHLVLEHPLAGDDACAGWPGDKGPGLVGQQCVVLGFHGRVPVDVLEC